MNALIAPIEPFTTMSTPFMDMPHRAEASPSITDDEVAMWRYVSRHPDANIEVLRVVH